jgi:MYXO-CTERM domain-containing protein
VDPDTQGLGIIRPKEPWTDGSVTVEFAFSGSGEYTSPESESHAVQTAADSDEPVFGADTIHNVRWRRVERGEDSFCGPSANNGYADWITYTIEQDGDETLTHFQLVTAVDAAGDEQTFVSTYGPSYRDFDHEFGVALPDDTACIEVRPVSISGAIGDPVETCSPKFRNENGRPMPAKACAAAGGSRPSGLWVLFGVVLLLVRRRDWMTTSN